MARTDIHRPSVIIPSDYDYVAMECVKIEGDGDAAFIIAERERIQRHMERTGGTYSHHAHGGNCHVCGAHAIYTALFHHKPTNVYVRTGTECADKMEWDSGEGEAFRQKVKHAMERRAGKEKARAILVSAGLSVAWDIYCATETSQHREEGIVADIVGKLVQYGSISEKQEAFLRKLVDTIARRAEIEAQRKAESEAAAPFPVTEDRVSIKGKVLSVREPRDYECFHTRILVQSDAGWKAWGSRPKALSGVRVGDVVEFSASVKPSDKDPKFGFFSRPTKAAVLAQAEGR